MIKINIETDKKYQGCYDSDREQWDLFVAEKDIKSIPTDLFLSQDGESYWHAYLIKAKYEPKLMVYSLTYKDY